MPARVVAFGVLSTLVRPVAAPLSAQTAYRLKGTARSGAIPVAATITAEATVGFRGEQCTGRKTFSVQTSEKGE